MRVIDPTFATTSTVSAGQVSTIDLQTASIVMFSNSKPNAAELLEGVRDRLHEHLGRGDIGFVAKNTASMAAPTDVVEAIARDYDVAVIALADCGSCSSYCFQDSLTLERLGVSTVIFTTKVFEKLVLAHARAAGVQPRLVVLDHPVAGLRFEQLADRAEDATKALTAMSVSGAGR